MKCLKVFKIVIFAIMVNIIVGNFASAAVKLVKGQTLYIPSYSNIIGDYSRIMLRANLIIHNTDPTKKITIIRIDNYDTNGKMVEKFLPKPLELDPMAAARFAIKDPKKGDEGAGANFLIQWKADNKVTEPIIECIMSGSHGTQGHTFTSQGRIIQEDDQ